ncbi:MAG: hypothetical protein ABR910_04315 [Acidobacteriaceae bacterium]|jgi:hypothetical protein
MTRPLRERRSLFLIPLAALFVVHPLIVHGCSCGHDFDFHLLNWMEAANQIAHGNLHPHWAYTPAFNAGEPRFVFYPPISWYVGALLGFLLTHLAGISEAAGWNAAPILFTWIALTLSGLTMHRLAREYASANAALLAAILYLANPYMLFTAFERTAYAELLAAAWIPLLLLSILRERITLPGVAVPVALLWLTNAPAAIMGTYTLAFLAVVRVVTNPGAPEPALSLPKGLASQTWESRHEGTSQLALRILAGTALGLALAAFYLIPAIYQRRYVQIAMATIAGMKIDQNFLFEHTGTSSDQLLHDAVLHTASVIALILFIATAIALAAIAARRARVSFPTLPLTILTAAIAFLLTPWSASLWTHAPEAALLQFPWRLLAILAPVLALAIAFLLSSHSPGAPSLTVDWVGRNATTAKLLAIAALAALILPVYHLFRQPCDPEDTAPARLALFHSNTGTDPTDEYTPTTADNDALTPNNPPYWLAGSPEAAAPAGATPGPAPTHLALAAPRPQVLILNLRDYPAWRIARNGVAVAPTEFEDRPDGLIAIPMPAGPSTVDIHYAHTLDQTLGDAISLIALVLLLITRLKSPSRS